MYVMESAEKYNERERNKQKKRKIREEREKCYAPVIFGRFDQFL